MNQVLKKNHGVCSLQKIKEKGKMDWKGFKMFLLICPFILLVALFAYYPLTVGSMPSLIIRRHFRFFPVIL